VEPSRDASTALLSIIVNEISCRSISSSGNWERASWLSCSVTTGGSKDEGEISIAGEGGVGVALAGDEEEKDGQWTGEGKEEEEEEGEEEREEIEAMCVSS